MSKLPKSYQGIFWFSDINKLDTKINKAHIIHQILRYGTLEEIKWLKKQYSLAEIQKIFISQPTKIYDRSSLNFVKNFLLKLDKVSINEDEYYNFTPRIIRKNKIIKFD